MACRDCLRAYNNNIKRSRIVRPVFPMYSSWQPIHFKIDKIIAITVKSIFYFI